MMTIAIPLTSYNPLCCTVIASSALSIKYENDNSLEMSKLDYKFIKLSQI